MWLFPSFAVCVCIYRCMKMQIHRVSSFYVQGCVCVCSSQRIGEVPLQFMTTSFGMNGSELCQDAENGTN